MEGENVPAVEPGAVRRQACLLVRTAVPQTCLRVGYEWSVQAQVKLFKVKSDTYRRRNENSTHLEQSVLNGPLKDRHC